MNRRRRRAATATHERGSAAIEAVIVLPSLLLFAALIIAAGRLTIAHQAVELAAAEAARSASVTRDPANASTVATSAATDTLSSHGLQCSSPAVAIDVSAFGRPVGQNGNVRANVTCVVGLDDVALPGLAGSITVTAESTSPLDRYRGRTR